MDLDDQAGGPLATLAHVVPMHAWASASRDPAIEPSAEATRILFAWSEAAGAVDHERHREAIEAECLGTPVSIDGVPDASAAAIRAALEAERWTERADTPEPRIVP